MTATDLSPATDLPDPTVGFALWRITQDLVRAALSGTSDADLVIVLGEALGAVGVHTSIIEVACDAVDPERANHFMRWRQGSRHVESVILAGNVFNGMLSENRTSLRYHADKDRFAPVMQDGATDAVAIANHLAPDVTLGFFDDVLSLFVTERPGGFTATDIDVLHRVTPVFALALGARLNAAAARILLQTYLGQDAATALLSGRVGLGDVARIRAVVLYCDLLGFTALTERLDAPVLIDHLNTFFETMTRPVSRAGGQVAGHVGDAVVMFFPVPDKDSERRLCATAVRAALAGLKAMDLLNDTRPLSLAAPLRARIGIDIGDVVHGNIGSPGRFSFTIIGTPVNRAARLQALAKDLGAVMLTTAGFAEAAAVQWNAFGKHALRGLEHPVDIVGLRVTD